VTTGREAAATDGPTPSPASPAAPPGRYHLRSVLRSEWTKLYSLRSTLWSLAATIVLTIAIGILATAVVASRWETLSTLDRLTFDPVRQSLTGLIFGQLPVGVLGILVVSGEYGTGTIRATFAAVPNRPMVLAAKAIVFGATALVLSEALSFTAFFVGQSILSGSTPYATLGQPGVAGAVVGGGLYLTMLGLFTMGIAAIIRHTAGSISTFVGVLFVLPLILQALPSSLIDAIGKYLPANIGVTMTSTREGIPGVGHQFPPWVGFGVLSAYAVAALVLGAWVMVRRDA
jgi:ABC-2 type transport system permease protein